jgi:hypothetical protein
MIRGCFERILAGVEEEISENGTEEEENGQLAEN